MAFIIGPTLCQALAIFRMIDLKAIFTSLYFYEKKLSCRMQYCKRELPV